MRAVACRILLIARYVRLPRGGADARPCGTPASTPVEPCLPARRGSSHPEQLRRVAEQGRAEYEDCGYGSGIGVVMW